MYIVPLLLSAQQPCKVGEAVSDWPNVTQGASWFSGDLDLVLPALEPPHHLSFQKNSRSWFLLCVAGSRSLIMDVLISNNLNLGSSGCKTPYY